MLRFGGIGYRKEVKMNFRACYFQYH